MGFRAAQLFETNSTRIRLRVTLEPDPAFLAEAPPPPDRHIHYGPAASQVAELRLPVPMRSDCPVVVLLHGGFWRSRYSAAHLGHAAAGLTQRGLATWNVEYRRVGEAAGGWPTTFTDVARAIAFLEQLAQEVTLDLSRVAIAGHSAGGHLALWSAAAQATTGVAAWSPRWRPRGLIGLAAVSDLRLADALDLSDGAVSALLGRDSLPARFAQTSPLELLPLGLPQVLVHGDQDSVVPPAMSSAYVTRALAAGDPVRLLRIADCGHFELIDPTSSAWPSVCEVVSQMLEL